MWRNIHAVLKEKPAEIKCCIENDVYYRLRDREICSTFPRGDGIARAAVLSRAGFQSSQSRRTEADSEDRVAIGPGLPHGDPGFRLGSHQW